MAGYGRAQWCGAVGKGLLSAAVLLLLPLALSAGCKGGGSEQKPAPSAGAEASAKQSPPAAPPPRADAAAGAVDAPPPADAAQADPGPDAAAATRAGGDAEDPGVAAQALLGELRRTIEDEAANPDVGFFEKLLLSLEQCQLTESGVAADCTARQLFDQGIRKRSTAISDPQNAYSALGKKHLRHPSGAVRATAAQLLSTVIGADETALTALVEVAEQETDPLVRRVTLDVLGPKIGADSRVTALILAASRHELAALRMQAANWLTTRFAEGVEGGLQRVIELIEQDPAPEVRAYTCGMSYRRSEPILIAVYRRQTENPDANPQIYESCMDALIHTWVGFPNPEKPSKEGYELTLERLRRTPRTETVPPSWPLRGIRAGKDKDWRAAAPFVNLKELRDLLAEIVVDRDAGWMTRTAAVEALADLDVEAADLAKLLRQYEGADYPHLHVANALQRLLDKR